MVIKNNFIWEMDLLLFDDDLYQYITHEIRKLVEPLLNILFNFCCRLLLTV